MCSPSGFIFMIIASLYFFNCLHLVVGATAPFDGSKCKTDNLNNRATNDNVGNAHRIGLHIDITRKRSIHLNGVEIDEDSLVHHLEDHERELIFGNNKKEPRAVKLVHLRHRTDVAATNSVRKPQMPHRMKRAAAAVAVAVADTKRGATDRQSEVSQQQKESLNDEVSVQIQDNDQTVSLKLQQAPKLIDDAFVFLRRYANFTQFIGDSHKLAENFENCFYSNENAALDLCDDETVRGVFQHNSSDFIIQPLPTRFGNSTHVILETEKFRSRFDKSSKVINEHLQFEPDLEDFNDLSVTHLSSIDSAEEVQRTIRNTVENPFNSSTSNYDEGSQNSTLNSNLSYKPRYSQSNNHQQHHQHQHHHQQQHQHQQQHHQLHRQHQHQHYNEEHDRKKQQHSTDQQYRIQNNLHHQRAPSQHNHNYQKHHRSHHRHRRYISTPGTQRQIPTVLHIETAIFVDNDLLHHMSKNFPKDTDLQLMRFVLTIINGVQLLYHHPTLGHRVNFVLKRLEILYKDPPDLGRSSDIDIYLNNFCMWQRNKNPASESDPFHYDHAVILTGLDLYVVGKNGKMISQVVGLAPVAGMCTPTSSCTINEGKHFESVFVVAHEIGHNLGMRHDASEIGCDSSSHIMSPTLGTGKITWSKCSRTYLNDFLSKDQARCLSIRSPSLDRNLDHSAEGLLPGERFNADKQCMLKYGLDSVRAKTQPLPDICRDLHCQRERYTWTSHPALDGTECGSNMWCRSGSCVSRPDAKEPNDIPKEPIVQLKPNYEKASFYESNKREHLLHSYNHNKPHTWGEWSDASECDSGCLYGPSNTLSEGSTGLRTYTRSCLDRRRCLGRDKKYESCISKLCFNVKKTTIEDFATNVCERTQKFDAELTGKGVQIVGDIEESCKVFCKTKTNGTKSRRRIFPDGTACHSKHYSFDATAYCIDGRCEKFSCDNSSSNYYKINPKFCQSKSSSISPTAAEMETRRTSSYNSLYPVSNANTERYNDRDNNYYNRHQNRFYGPTTVRSKYENEVAVRNFHGQRHDTYKHKPEPYNHWNKYNYRLNDQYPLAATQPVAASLKAAPPQIESEWIVKSGCHSSCMAESKGVQVVTSRRTGANNIQLCTHAVKPCDHLLTPTEYADNTCSRYKRNVRGLSGYGTQIAASVDNPDRSCRVGCQDEHIKYRFYLVSSKYGLFPLGTKCSDTEERYCVNGKCLEFGADNIPLQQSHISLALYRNRRSVSENQNTFQNATKSRSKRSFLYYTPVNITETITQDFINSIVNSIISYERKQIIDDIHTADHIEFTNPIHMSMDELSIK